VDLQEEILKITRAFYVADKNNPGVVCGRKDIESLCKRYADEKLEEAIGRVRNTFNPSFCGNCHELLEDEIAQLKSGEGKEGK
jgi:hypothetical protein